MDPSPEEKQRSSLEEKERLELRERLNREKPKAKMAEDTRKRAIGCLVLLGIVGLLILIAYFVKK